MAPDVLPSQASDSRKSPLGPSGPKEKAHRPSRVRPHLCQLPLTLFLHCQHLTPVPFGHATPEG